MATRHLTAADLPFDEETVVHNDTFRAALLDFEQTRSLPPPEEGSAEWLAWDAACIKAYRVVVASVDHYCARRVLDALAEARGE